MQSGIHDQFVGELVRAVSLMRQGDGFREDVTQGPLINDSAVDKVRTRKVKPVFCTADMIPIMSVHLNPSSMHKPKDK